MLFVDNNHGKCVMLSTYTEIVARIRKVVIQFRDANIIVPRPFYADNN